MICMAFYSPDKNPTSVDTIISESKYKKKKLHISNVGLKSSLEWYERLPSFYIKIWLSKVICIILCMHGTLDSLLSKWRGWHHAISFNNQVQHLIQFSIFRRSCAIYPITFKQQQLTLVHNVIVGRLFLSIGTIPIIHYRVQAKCSYHYPKPLCISK